jgi:hypothetical protein
LLPSKLPSVVRIGEIQLAAGELRKYGYFISLCYSDPCSGATYAAGFGASTRITAPKDLPNTRPVALANHRTGLFRPVSCGGSCAPANLLWAQGGVQYTIQVKLPSNTPVAKQSKILIQAANASVLARKE